MKFIPIVFEHALNKVKEVILAFCVCARQFCGLQVTHLQQLRIVGVGADYTTILLGPGDF